MLRARKSGLWGRDVTLADRRLAATQRDLCATARFGAAQARNSLQRARAFGKSLTRKFFAVE